MIQKNNVQKDFGQSQMKNQKGGGQKGEEDGGEDLSYLG